jgi:L-2-hydroxyglutarate oxidase
VSRYVVIGGGIIGLASARAVLLAEPDADVTVLEKEPALALHQTGRNSGVIHSGIYYRPGSAKATMCRAGAASMGAYAEEHRIALQRTGKLIVATSGAELPGLEALHERAIANDIPVTRLGPEQAREYEPFISCVGALRVSTTAITDYPAVCVAMAEEIGRAGGRIRLNTTVRRVQHRDGETIVDTSSGPVLADVVINCAGLYADRIADTDTSGDGDPGAGERIVPFRGEYYELRADRAHLVKGLIYPVPDPDFPFLGVHLTRMVDGSVHAGPNAVLALAREGYRWRTVNTRDILDVLRFPGFWNLARHNLRAGSQEVFRSLSKKRFAASLARLVPGISADDLVRSKAGVRAQALTRQGNLVDDFAIRRNGRTVHVLNAPSPAATSALEIGKHIAGLATQE